MSDIYLRPRKVLDLFSRNYHDTWREVDVLRARRRELGNWPDWCFLPLALVQTIVARGKHDLSPDEYKLVTILGALAAWRATQGVYSFDATTFDALWKTPVTGEIPTKVLYHLPEWCVYIPTPDKNWRGECLNGFFAHLEYDLAKNQTELRLLLDVSRRDGNYDAVAFPIRMGMGGIAASLEDTLRVRVGHERLATDLTADDRAKIMKDVPALVSLVLYLCSECTRSGRRSRGQAHRVNPGP